LGYPGCKNTPFAEKKKNTRFKPSDIWDRASDEIMRFFWGLK